MAYDIALIATDLAGNCGQICGIWGQSTQRETSCGAEPKGTGEIERMKTTNPHPHHPIARHSSARAGATNAAAT